MIANKTPAKTPMAKLWVRITNKTVINMTDKSVNLKPLFRAILCQSKVAIDTVIIMPISDAVGMANIKSFIEKTRISNVIPLVKVDSLVRPPD